jgi:hypothetical protein
MLGLECTRVAAQSREPLVHTYLTADDLGRPDALCFDATADERGLAVNVRRLAMLWGTGAADARIGRNDWLRAWRNVRVLADRFMATVDATGRSDPETFHHLLLAVGNFKRQAGDIHIPVELAELSISQQRESFKLPGGLGRLDKNDVATWKGLEQIPGLGIPTASCLLAALWPDDHAIMDVFDRRAVVGIQVGRRSHTNLRLDTSWIPSHRWWFYDWFRRTVTLTAHAAECEPVLVERALYILGKRTARSLGGEWNQRGSWSKYHSAAISITERPKL